MEVAEQKNLKGYKQTEVGYIPEDWGVAELKSVTTLLTDGAHLSPPTAKRGKPIATVENIVGNDIDVKSCRIISELDYQQLVKNNCKPSPGDVLLSKDGTIGLTLVIAKDMEIVLLSSIALIRPKKELLNSGFLREILKSSYFYKHLHSVKSGSAIKRIVLVDIRKFRLPLPPSTSEQKLIADTLFDIEEYITALDKLIEKKKKMKTATMQQLLNGRKRLPGFNDEWSQCTYGDFVFLRTAAYSRDKLSEDGEARYIHYGDIHTKWSHVLDLKVSNLPGISTTMVSSYALLQDGDLIMADASEDYEGVAKSVEIQNSDGLKIISGLHTYAMRDVKKLFAPGFKGYIHSISTVREQIKKKTVGMKVFGVSKNNLKDIAIPLPSKDEQSAIVSVLSDMQNEITILQEKRNKLAEMKLGAMQELLTGKIRLI